MFIEDLILKTVSSLMVKLNTFDEKIVYNIYSQLLMGQSLTEKQGLLTVAILKKYKKQISQAMNTDVSQFLDTPTFKQSFRTINTKKSISIVAHPSLKKVIKVEFPYQDDIIGKIKLYKSKFHKHIWDNDQKSWIFSLDEHNIDFLLSLSAEFNFTLCEEFQLYAEQVSNIKENLEKFVPLLSIENNLPVLKNVAENVPQLDTDDLIEAIFQARKLGVYNWDNLILEKLNTIDIQQPLKNFLKQDPDRPFTLNTNNYRLSDIFDIVKHLSPCLFILPGGMELGKLEIIYDFLTKNKVEQTEISVMLRLPSETGKKFNDFIKEHNLNNPITEHTKIVIAGTKIPKPVIQSNIKFHSVFNFGFGGVHYLMKNFIQNQENLVFVTETNTQQEMNFGYL